MPIVANTTTDSICSEIETDNITSYCISLLLYRNCRVNFKRCWVPVVANTTTESACREIETHNDITSCCITALTETVHVRSKRCWVPVVAMLYSLLYFITDLIENCHVRFQALLCVCCCKNIDHDRQHIIYGQIGDDMDIVS